MRDEQLPLAYRPAIAGRETDNGERLFRERG
jgi:hypothetical protein